MKQHVQHVVWADLACLAASAGDGGGQLSPSVYDTAQVLRLAPPEQGVDAAIEWLLSEQEADGGWGPRHVPRARELPTLAVVLALKAHGKSEQARAAMRAGLEFLERQTDQWLEIPDDLLSGLELTLPTLIEEAEQSGLRVLDKAYSALSQLRARRLGMLAKLHIRAGTTAMFSWEGWGKEPDPELVDSTGGVGSSPAATAAWVRAAEGRPELARTRDAARRYLELAAASTPAALPGVVPASWPNDRFEQAWVLYALKNANLLSHPALRSAAQPALEALRRAIKKDGIGFNDVFVSDGDMTATTLLILATAGVAVDMSLVRAFQKGSHFFTYPGEIQPSLTTTAHAMSALAHAKSDVGEIGDFLASKQREDGVWHRDKWHTSWLYTTSRILRALAAAGTHPRSLERGILGLLGHQRPDGGWGAGACSTTAETAYALLALTPLCAAPTGAADVAWDRVPEVVRDPRVAASIRRATRWLLDNYRPFATSARPLWIGKDLYWPSRIDKAFELAAIAAATSLPGSL